MDNKRKTTPSMYIGKTEIFLAVLSGILMTAAFPNIGFSWAAWFAMVPLLVAMRHQPWGNSFRLGFIAGLAHYFTLMYWLFHTMRTYGYLPWYLSVAILVLMVSYVSLYLGAFTVLIQQIARTPGHLVWQVPVFWVSLEFLRSKLFSGLPWELMGYSQHDTLHLIQIADVFGIYGVSFVIALGNAVAFIGYLLIRDKDWGNIKVTKRLFAVSLACFACLFLSTWVYGDKRLKFFDDLISRSPNVQIAVVQGNIDQTVKWDPKFQEKTIDDYIKLSESVLSDDLELIVWPETATPFYLLRDAKSSERVLKGMLNTGKDFLIGSPSYVNRGNRIDYFNSAYLIQAEGSIAGKYDKVHLVPFGEYVPLKKWLPFIGKLVEQVGDFKPGKRGSTIPWRDLKIGMQICYEIIFPNLSRRMVQNGADLLVNITNDAWFGRTGAPYQHFSMAAIRAVENRRALVRAANTGISGFVDPAGRVLATTPLFEEKALKQKIPVLKTKTIYSRYGDFFAITCFVAALVGLIQQYRSKLRFRR